MGSTDFRRATAEVLKELREDRFILFLLVAIIVDFLFTTVGLLFLGTRWELNPFLRSTWGTGQYSLYVAYWLVIGLAYSIILYVFAKSKRFCRGSSEYRWLVRPLNAIIVYAGLQKLYLGGVLWSILIGCNYVSSIGTCTALINSNAELALIFQVLNTVFPTSI